jgi:hypothetical protein
LLRLFQPFDGYSFAVGVKSDLQSPSPSSSVFLLRQEPHHQETRTGMRTRDAHEADVGSQPADTTKSYFRKAVRAFEWFALAWRLLFRLTGRSQRIEINA